MLFYYEDCSEYYPPKGELCSVVLNIVQCSAAPALLCCFIMRPALCSEYYPVLCCACNVEQCAVLCSAVQRCTCLVCTLSFCELCTVQCSVVHCAVLYSVQCWAVCSAVLCSAVLHLPCLQNQTTQPHQIESRANSGKKRHLFEIYNTMKSAAFRGSWPNMLVKRSWNF